MGGPAETSPSVDHMFTDGVIVGLLKKCEVCGDKQDGHRSPEDYIKFHYSHYIKKLGQFCPKDVPIEFYYVINDCLSCS
jgi:hypothetical protein